MAIPNHHFSFLEFGCLPYGVIYYVTIPSMYLLLVIFSIYNLNDVSWGTREVAADAVSLVIESNLTLDIPKISEIEK